MFGKMELCQNFEITVILLSKDIIYLTVQLEVDKATDKPPLM